MVQNEFHKTLSRNCFCVSVVVMFCSRPNGGETRTVSRNWNVDSQDFKTMVTNGIFVDKTLFVSEVINNDDKVFQIIRPRKWGKSMNLNMLKYFFDIELDKYGNVFQVDKQVHKVIFMGGNLRIDDEIVTLKPLKISYHSNVVDRHLGKHPVILLSLKDIKGKNYTEFERKLKYLISNLFKSYHFLHCFLDDESDILDLPEKARLAQFITGNIEDEYFVSCFEFLSSILYKYFHSEVVLLIDDYDFPLINAYLEFEDKNREFDSIVVMLRVLFENAFKENRYLFKGIITGTLNFFVVSTGLSDYHFVDICTILDKPFWESYGFTKKDIGELLSKTDFLFNTYQVQKWYGGINLHGEEMFNPLSVMKFITWRGKYDYYLHRSFTTDFTRMIDKAFLLDDLQEYFHLLIEGKEMVRSVMAESVYMRGVTSDYFSLFVHAGYLKLIPPEKVTDKPIWRMKIPNMDVRGIFASGVGKWVANELLLNGVQYEMFINLLVSKQVKKFGQELENFLIAVKCGETERTTEEWYHNMVAGMVCSLGMKYLVELKKEVGENKGGNLLVPFEDKDIAAIYIEYKICRYTHLLESAVKEDFVPLLNKTRAFTLKVENHEHVKNIIYIILGFSGPKVMTRYRIFNL